MRFVPKDNRSETVGQEVSLPVMSILERAGVEAVEPVHALREMLEVCPTMR